MNIVLPESDQELLKECEWTAFCASGKGGQHVNKTYSAVRLKHIPTGIVVYSQDQSSQYLNKKDCVKKLRKKVWRLNYIAPTRIETKIPSFIKEGIFVSKKKHSEKKRSRKKIALEDET